MTPAHLLELLNSNTPRTEVAAIIAADPLEVAEKKQQFQFRDRHVVGAEVHSSIGWDHEAVAAIRLVEDAYDVYKQERVQLTRWFAVRTGPHLRQIIQAHERLLVLLQRAEKAHAATQALTTDEIFQDL